MVACCEKKDSSVEYLLLSTSHYTMLEYKITNIRDKEYTWNTHVIKFLCSNPFHETNLHRVWNLEINQLDLLSFYSHWHACFLLIEHAKKRTLSLCLKEWSPPKVSCSVRKLFNFKNSNVKKFQYYSIFVQFRTNYT